MEQDINTPEDVQAEDGQLSLDEQIKQVAAVLAGNPDSPSEEELMSWKQTYKSLLLLPITDDEIYVYRKLTRSEYREIMTVTNSIKLANPNIDNDDLQAELEMNICKTAVLYPRNIEEVLEESAGISMTLTEQITLGSGFIPTDVAASLVVKI